MTVTNQPLLTSELSQVSHHRTCDTTGMSETITPGSRPPPPFDSARPVLRLTVLSELRARPWFGETFTRFQTLLKLGENWNGYGEKAVHENAVKRALNVLEAIGTEGPAPWVVPTFEGGLQLEWTGNDYEIEVDIPPEGSASVLIVGPNNTETEHSVGSQSEVWATLRELITEIGRETT